MPFRDESFSALVRSPKVGMSSASMSCASTGMAQGGRDQRLERGLGPAQGSAGSRGV